MGIADYKTQPDDNTQISGINIAEGCPPGNLNNAQRQLMADIAADVAPLIKLPTEVSPGLVPAGLGKNKFLGTGGEPIDAKWNNLADLADGKTVLFNEQTAKFSVPVAGVDSNGLLPGFKSGTTPGALLHLAKEGNDWVAAWGGKLPRPATLAEYNTGKMDPSQPANTTPYLGFEQYLAGQTVQRHIFTSSGVFVPARLGLVFGITINGGWGGADSPGGGATAGGKSGNIGFFGFYPVVPGGRYEVTVGGGGAPGQPGGLSGFHEMWTKLNGPSNLNTQGLQNAATAGTQVELPIQFPGISRGDGGAGGSDGGGGGGGGVVINGLPDIYGGAGGGPGAAAGGRGYGAGGGGARTTSRPPSYGSTGAQGAVIIFLVPFMRMSY